MGLYWSNLLSNRIRRRRALAMAGSAALASAVLASCGGDDQPGQANERNLVAEPVDTLQRAKRNGLMKDRTPWGDPASLDVSLASNSLRPISTQVYSTLVLFKPGFMKPSENEVGPDLAESWEYSPDGLQIALKLRQGVRWHNKPPVNGRSLDVEDVLFSWDRFTRKSALRSSIANVVDPRAPVLSLTAPDSRTIVINLKEPVIYGLGLFSPTTPGGLYIIPKETDTTFDMRADMIGTGPWAMADYTPSVGFTLKRHADYYDKDWALVEQVDLPLISEYASALAQLKAGNIYSMGSENPLGVKQEDILTVKREEPRLSVYQSILAGASSLQSFGWLPEGKSPFLDERIRQAVSMAIDRDLYIDTFGNVSQFEADGLPIEARWNTSLTADFEGWWLDPKSKSFGPNAKYYEHNLPEAKKLLAAAGYPSGFETISNYVTGPQLGVPRHKEVLDSMIGEAGISSKVNSIDYAKEYTPKYRDGKGQYEGWAYITASGGAGRFDPIGSLANQFWSDGGTASFHGFSLNGKNDLSGDPKLDAMIEPARLERDDEKRRNLVFDIQRYLAKALYSLEPPGMSTSFTMAWPCLGNFHVYWGRRYNYRLWVDETKPPFKTS
jgi:peptide/nickel transport system substrate-binding protein